jgi:hypothetical protein
MRITSITLGLCLVMSTFVMAEEKKPAGQMDMQGMMDLYRKLATPGEQHKLLASMAGTWNTTTKEWMDPNKPPEESTGSCKQTMVLGGRFLQQECTGTMMGQPFNGMGVTGYDNHTKKYQATWMDSMGTGIYFFEGSAGDDGKTITMESHYDDPMAGPMKLRAVTKIIDPNTEIFEMYGTDKSGQEMKMLEIRYSRKG